ncbi:NIF-domain-containing protein [Mycena sanguinolenta]|uniref:NIF-domain-containing protein n=1 Tax=Mycena sanguinolenta TaxID=230812 RepID=A0A8H6WR52_9AGAR|nr:NIF-domain-containing protein [Mycena sanguinolenta]
MIVGPESDNSTGGRKRTMFFRRRRNRSANTRAAGRLRSRYRSCGLPLPEKRPSSHGSFLNLFLVSPIFHTAGELENALTAQTNEIHSSAAVLKRCLRTSTWMCPFPCHLRSINPQRLWTLRTSLPQSPPVLIENETEGSRPSSVTPLGSADEISALTHTAAFSDESEATSFFDDEGDIDPFPYDEDAEEQRLIKNGGSGIPIGPDGTPRPLLPPSLRDILLQSGYLAGVPRLADSCFAQSFAQPDFIFPVEIDSQWHRFHVLKRPGVENFLKEMGEIYEVVVWTAALSQYANLVLDRLDPHQSVAHRLFRQSCFLHKGAYVKDLSQLGRPLADTIILDNSPVSFLFHPHNSVPVSSWFNDPHDGELTDLIPFLLDLAFVADVRGILNGAIP